MPWTKEEAIEAARKGGKQKGINAKRRAEMTPEERAMDAVRNKSDDISKELIDAAFGQGDFTELDINTRAKLLIRLMEWNVGKPATLKLDPKKEEDEPDGLSIS